MTWYAPAEGLVSADCPPPFREEATALTELGGVGVLWCERVSLPVPALDVPEHTLP